jgi:hypothetical protein
MKTSELIGPALDWAVAIALGYKDQIAVTDYGSDEEPFFAYPVRDKQDEVLHARGDRFKPSTDWSQGGPIIEREKLDLYHRTGRNVWSAAIWEDLPGGGQPMHKVVDCPTPLIAAMRCFVASKLGDEVEVPWELL